MNVPGHPSHGCHFERMTARSSARSTPISASCAWVAALSLGCATEMQVGRLELETTGPGSGGFGADAAADADDSTDSGGDVVCQPVECRGRPRACGDCIDNDDDGRRDAEDPDCFGPCDDSEVSFAGRANPCPSSACFFDADCGLGNDQACLKLVPNGCDCFGCCSFGGESWVHLGSRDAVGVGTCSASSVADPEACQPCEPDLNCLNPCEECELCIGQSAPGPACATALECPASACAPEVERCLPACDDGCADGTACITGCCQTVGE